MGFIKEFLAIAERYTTPKELAYARLVDATDQACGSVAVHFDLTTGEPKKTIYRCKRWRTCDNCRRVREHEIAARVQGLMEANETTQLVAHYVDDKEYAKIRRKAGDSKNLLRFPQHDGTNIVLAPDTPEVGDIVMSVADFCNEEIVAMLADTPERKRVSGWSAPEIEEEEDDAEEVSALRCDFFVSNPHQAEMIAAEAIEEVGEIEIEDPHRDVQWAITLLENAFVSVAERHNIPVETPRYSKRIYVKVKDVKRYWFRK
jgi:hypothetical protein